MSIPEHLQDGIHVARVAEVTQSSHADNGRRPTPWQPPWISAARRCVVSFQINISAIHWQTGLSVILNWTHMCSSSYVCRQWWHYSHSPAACCSAVCYAAHTCLMALCPGLPGWAGTRKVKPIWILLEQEIVSGSGISWACASLHLAPDR